MDVFCFDIDSIECILVLYRINIYSIDRWLKSPESAFQNFLRIENPLNIKKVMGRNVWMCFVSTVLDSIECIRDPCRINSINIYSIDEMVEKPWVSAFQNFLRIENPLNIKTKSIEY